MTVTTTPGKPRTALGMGLDALLPDRLEGQYFLCAVEDIRPSPHPPRQQFPDEAIQELADSIREKGLIQPVILRRGPDGRYELIAGERRWRAAQRAGLTELPAVLRDADEEDVLELALIENLQREDLNPIEEAIGYVRLSNEFGIKQEEIGQRVGKSRASIANAMRLLDLQKDIQALVAQRKLSVGHAKAILSIKDQDTRLLAAERILKKSLTVRAAERLAQQLSQGKDPKSSGKSTRKQLEPQIAHIRSRLRDHFATQVNIHHGPKRGKIELEYYGEGDLQRLLDVFGVTAD